MKKTGYAYSDIFLKHETPQWHPESAQRLTAINNLLNNSGIMQKLVMIEPRRASEEEVGLVHTAEYIQKVENFGSGYIDLDTYMSEGSAEAAFYAAGALINAVESCASGTVNSAFCAVRPPGHHAESSRAAGFCIFNNIAIAARAAQGRGFKKIFIADFDVHHGNGTQMIFDHDDSVYYFSTHQSPLYPGTGSAEESGSGKGYGFSRNIPLKAGTEDAEFIEIYNTALPESVNAFQPDMMLVSAGYDLHINDPIGGMNVSDVGVKGIVDGILSAAWSGRKIPVIFALEGGYNLRHLAYSVKTTIECMLNFPD
ncbi:MAG: histone deacetylase [Nitrospiraceae bacterium]|nr:histone deacetylase [Nitrospiraceae bacterium]